MEFYFSTEQEAKETRDKIINIMIEKKWISTKEVYELCGYQSEANVSDRSQGWTSDGRTFRISKYDNRFILILPDPKELIRKIDMIDHPPHYKSENGMETIDVIEAFTSNLRGIEATDTGNIIKYICRWKEKNGIEDLKKAKWYIEHLIKHLEKEND